MKKYVFGLMALVLAIFFTSQAYAAPVSSAFFTDGAVNLADDRDADLLVDADSSGTITVGDFLLAVLKVDTIEREGGPDRNINAASSGFNELTGISLIKVATKAAAGTFSDGTARWDFTFESPTILEWTGVTTALGHAVTPTAVGTMFIVKDGGPIHDYTRDGTVAAGLASADGTTMWEAGFTGAPGGVFGGPTPTGGEGWFAEAPDTFGAFSSAVVRNGSFVIFGTNVTATGPAAGAITLVPTTQFGGVTNFGAPTHFQGTGGFLTAGTGSGFGLFSETKTYITPLPEPNSMVLLGMGSVLLAGLARCRRKKDGEAV